MKKIVSMFLACALCLGLLAGCQGQGEPEPFTVEDFYAYDENGNILEKEPEPIIIPEWFVKRDIVVGDDASKIIEKYPLNYVFAVTAGPPEECEDLGKRFNNNVDKIRSSGEIDYPIYVDFYFYEDLAGNLYTEEDIEKGKVNISEIVKSDDLCFFWRKEK